MVDDTTKRGQRRWIWLAVGDVLWTLPMVAVLLAAVLLGPSLPGLPWALPTGALIGWLAAHEIRHRWEKRERESRKSEASVMSLACGVLGAMVRQGAEPVIADADRCPVCEGHGRFDDVFCLRCNGTGRAAKGKEAVQQ